MNLNYAAIIIDIQHSRNSTEYERFLMQEKLYSIVNFVNSYYKNRILKTFEFSSGDSIQALFTNVADAFVYYCFVRNLFYPYRIRCGIGFGPINKRIFERDYRSTNMVDGIAYHLAIDALSDCKSEDYDILLYSQDGQKDDMVNQIMHTLSVFSDDHTTTQADVYNFFNLLYPLEIIYESQYVEEIADFIIEKVQQNVISYNFNISILKENIAMLLNEAKFEFSTRTKKSQRTFYQVYPRKMNLFCASLIGVTRQNISKMRLSGRFDEMRKLENLALNYIKKEY